MAKGTTVPAGHRPYLYQGKSYGPGDAVPEGFPVEAFERGEQRLAERREANPDNRVGLSGSGEELDEEHQVVNPRSAVGAPEALRATGTAKLPKPAPKGGAGKGGKARVRKR